MNPLPKRVLSTCAIFALVACAKTAAQSADWQEVVWREYYHRTAEAAHEMGCQEAVARSDAGVKITNLGQFERKKVDGKVLITPKARTNASAECW